MLIFSKYFYMASISSYYTFYLMQKFGLSVQNAQIHLFAFLFAVAAGTVIGGPVGDKIGRKYVIWGSILGVAPFTLVLPYASLEWTGILTVIIGFILASAFSAILVYAQELLPGRIGMVSGLFFGFAFGMGGLGAAVLGMVADHTSIFLVYKICAFLPLLGMLTIFLPDNRPAKSAEPFRAANYAFSLPPDAMGFCIRVSSPISLRYLLFKIALRLRFCLIFSIFSSFTAQLFINISWRKLS